MILVIGIFKTSFDHFYYMSHRHKVFVSYYHDEDERYRNLFEQKFTNIYVSKSVKIGEIDPNLKVDTIRQIIREKYLSDTSVTVVLIGKHTWQRKHVDWEISSSIRETKISPRSGLLGILLPTHPDYQRDKYNPFIIPPRLYDNIKCGYAKLYDWSDYAETMESRIHNAFLNRDKILPNNSRQLFVNNRSGDKWQ